MHATPTRWLRYSLRGLLMAITLLSIWLAKEVAPIRERHAVVRMIEARGGVWHSPANLMFPGPEMSLTRRLLGDVPLQKSFWLGVDQGFTDAEMERIQRAFPEARVKVGKPAREGQEANSMERWPTVEENRERRERIASGEWGR